MYGYIGCLTHQAWPFSQPERMPRSRQVAGFEEELAINFRPQERRRGCFYIVRPTLTSIHALDG